MNLDDPPLPHSVNEWLTKHGHTQRHLYLHPDDLTYETEQSGKLVRPLANTVLNTDHRPLEKLKREYFFSKTFKELPVESQLLKLARLGASEWLRQELLLREHTRRLVEETIW